MPQSRFQRESSFQRVIRDVTELFELQIQLFSVDSQVARRKLVRAAIYGGAAAVLAGSALTVALIACGFLLDEATELSTGGALLVVSVIVFVIVAVLGWLAVAAVEAATDAMSETKSELAENIRWLKATLISPETSARNQLRRESFRGRTSASYQDTARDPAESYHFDDLPDRHPLPPR